MRGPRRSQLARRGLLHSGDRRWFYEWRPGVIAGLYGWRSIRGAPHSARKLWRATLESNQLLIDHRFGQPMIDAQQRGKTCQPCKRASTRTPAMRPLLVVSVMADRLRSDRVQPRAAS